MWAQVEVCTKTGAVTSVVAGAEEGAETLANAGAGVRVGSGVKTRAAAGQGAGATGAAGAATQVVVRIGKENQEQG